MLVKIRISRELRAPLEQEQQDPAGTVEWVVWQAQNGHPHLVVRRDVLAGLVTRNWNGTDPEYYTKSDDPKDYEEFTLSEVRRMAGL